MRIGPSTLDPTRVILINPATDSAENAASSACYPPLGLISLGTSLRASLPDTDVQIFDQAVAGSEHISKQLVAGTIVGISALTTTYRNSLRFAEEAIENGCFVVFGNDHSSRFAEHI